MTYVAQLKYSNVYTAISNHDPVFKKIYHLSISNSQLLSKKKSCILNTNNHYLYIFFLTVEGSQKIKQN